MIRKLNNVLLAVSALLALAGFWHRNDLPAGLAFRGELAAEPRQTATEEPPFSVVYAGVSYRIEPQFAYDLYGRSSPTGCTTATAPCTGAPTIT